MASHLAPPDRSLHLLLEHFESYSDLSHDLLGKSVFPECVRVDSVDFVCIFNTRQYFDSVLVGGLFDPSVDLTRKNNVTRS